MKSSEEIQERQLCKAAVLTLRQEHPAHRVLLWLHKIYSRGTHSSSEKKSMCAHTHPQACTHTPTHTHPHIPSGTFRSTLFCYCTTVGIINRLEKDYSINPLRDCFYSRLCNISQSQPIMPQPVNETQ